MPDVELRDVEVPVFALREVDVPDVELRDVELVPERDDRLLEELVWLLVLRLVLERELLLEREDDERLVLFV